MKYLLDNDFPFGLDKQLISQNDLNNLGLQIIGIISTQYLFINSNELKSFFKTIDSKCKDKHLWVLLGSNDSVNWLPIQLASISAENEDVRAEIKTDLKRMLPFDPQIDIKEWSSKFYGVIMQVEVGKDVICQKYSKIREKCKELSIAILTKEEYGNNHMNTISKYQEKEIELAYELKPLIWNPSPKEKKYIKDNNLE